jgi:hypothetical protein
VEENKGERRNKTALNDTTATKDSSIITDINLQNSPEDLLLVTAGYDLTLM